MFVEQRRSCRLAPAGDMTLHGRALLPCTPVTANFTLDGHGPTRHGRPVPLMLLPTGERTRLVDDPWTRSDTVRRLRSDFARSASASAAAWWRHAATDAAADGSAGAGPLMIIARPPSRTHRPGSEGLGAELDGEFTADGVWIDRRGGSTTSRPGMSADEFDMDIMELLKRAGAGGGTGEGGGGGGGGPTVNTWSRTSIQDARKAAADRSRLLALERVKKKQEQQSGVGKTGEGVEATCDACRRITQQFGGDDEFLEMLRAGKVPADVEKSLLDLLDHDCSLRRKMLAIKAQLEADGTQRGDGDVTGRTGSDDGRGGAGSERYGKDGQLLSPRSRQLQADAAAAAAAAAGEGDGRSQRLSSSSSPLKAHEGPRRSINFLTDLLSLNDVSGRRPDSDDDDSVSVASLDEEGRLVRRTRVTKRVLKERMLNQRRPAARQRIVDFGGAAQLPVEATPDLQPEEPVEAEESGPPVEPPELGPVDVPSLPDLRMRRRTTIVRPRLRASITRPRTSVIDGITPHSRSFRGKQIDSRYLYPPLFDQRESSASGLGAMKPETLYLSQPVQAARFELPVDVFQLQDLSVADYLSRCCRLPADQFAIYRLIYEQRANRLTEKLHMAELRLALRDVIPVDITADDVKMLCSMCGGIEPDRLGVECELFVGIASLAARVLQQSTPKTSKYNWISSSCSSNNINISAIGCLPHLSTLDSAAERKSLLESTDLSALDRKLDGVAVDSCVSQVLRVL